MLCFVKIQATPAPLMDKIKTNDYTLKQNLRHRVNYYTLKIVESPCSFVYDGLRNREAGPHQHQIASFNVKVQFTSSLQ